MPAPKKPNSKEKESTGSKITVSNGILSVPADPIIPFIEGDGTGPEIWKAAVGVFEAAVKWAYGGKKRIVWKEVLAGEKAFKQTGQWLPEETLEAIREHVVAIKGPLTTPVGGGIRSLNVTMRQVLDLYACVRPVRYFSGVVSPVKNPQDLDVVIFRENTEDVYAGIEWPAGSPEVTKLITFINKEFTKNIHLDSAMGLKPMSAANSKRLIRRAFNYALEKGCHSVTLVHKGNIMKYTEGAFKQWGYELAREEFMGRVISEEDLAKTPGARLKKGQVMLKNLIADNTFQQLLLRPQDFDVIATPNLNGDYLSDACAAQVGGLGLAPGANIGDQAAVFEATHGTAPKLAGLDKVNPSSVILSGCMMLEHLGWDKASRLIQNALAKTIAKKTVTIDLAQGLKGARVLSCSQFGKALEERIRAEKG